MSDVTETDGVIKVRVAKLGTAVVDITLEAGATVADALNLVSQTLGTGNAYVDGKVVGKNTELEDGDTLTVAPKIKGGC